MMMVIRVVVVVVVGARLGGVIVETHQNAVKGVSPVGATVGNLVRN